MFYLLVIQLIFKFYDVKIRYKVFTYFLTKINKQLVGISFSQRPK